MEEGGRDEDARWEGEAPAEPFCRSRRSDDIGSAGASPSLPHRVAQAACRQCLLVARKHWRASRQCHPARMVFSAPCPLPPALFPRAPLLDRPDSAAYPER
jgi:hypothetical protein